MAQLITKEELLSTTDNTERVKRVIESYCDKLIKNLSENYRIYGSMRHTELLVPVDGIEGSRLSNLIKVRLTELGYSVKIFRDAYLNGQVVEISLETPKEKTSNAPRWWTSLLEKFTTPETSDSEGIHQEK